MGRAVHLYNWLTQARIKKRGAWKSSPSIFKFEINQKSGQLSPQDLKENRNADQELMFV